MPSNATASQRSGRGKRDDHPIDSGGSDSPGDVFHYFVPGEKIVGEVLIYYVTKFIDAAATIKLSSHPTVRLLCPFVLLIL